MATVAMRNAAMATAIEAKVNFRILQKKTYFRAFHRKIRLLEFFCKSALFLEIPGFAGKVESLTIAHRMERLETNIFFF